MPEERTRGVRAAPYSRRHQYADPRQAPRAARRRGAREDDAAEDIAECVLLAINLPARAIIEEMIVRPR